MSLSAGGSPGTGGFAGGYSAGPHSGVPTSQQDMGLPSGTEDRARTALLLGVLAIPFSMVAGVPAIIVGAHALRRIEASAGTVKGRGMAWCGIVLGAASVIAFVVGAVLIYS